MAEGITWIVPPLVPILTVTELELPPYVCPHPSGNDHMKLTPRDSGTE